MAKPTFSLRYREPDLRTHGSIVVAGEVVLRGQLVIRDPGQLVGTIEGWGRVQQALGGQDVAGVAGHPQRTTIDTAVVLAGGSVAIQR